MQPHRVTREFVSPLAVAEAADRQLLGLMGLRAMRESALLDVLPPEGQETAELIAPRDPRHRWIAVDDVAQEEASPAITPASPQDIQAQLRQLDRAYRHLNPHAQEQVAREIYRQARQAEKEELATSLTAMDQALDSWTPADAAATRAKRAGRDTKHRAATTWQWVKAELALLRANPDGHRLAEAARRAAEAGLSEAFTQASVAARAALDRRTRDIAAGLQAQIAQAADRAMLYEVANASMLAGAIIGADVLQHLEAVLEQREAELAAQAAQTAACEWARAELGALKAAPNGQRLAAAARRLAQAGLTEVLALDLAEARRALRAQAYGLALSWRPRIRAASDFATLEVAVRAARQAGAAIGAETLVAEFIAVDIARRQKKLAKEAARQAQSAATTNKKGLGTPLSAVCPCPSPHRGDGGPQGAPRSGGAEAVQADATATPHPAPAPAEVDQLLAELRERNPRVALNRRCVRFHALTSAEQAGFVATVLSLQRQIEKCRRTNAPVVIRQCGLRVIPASELRPGMRLVGLDWMAKRLERAA